MLWDSNTSMMVLTPIHSEGRYIECQSIHLPTKLSACGGRGHRVLPDRFGSLCDILPWQDLVFLDDDNRGSE
jgi:hypothetical protein